MRAVDAVCLTLQYLWTLVLKRRVRPQESTLPERANDELQGSKPFPENKTLGRMSRLLYLGWVWIELVVILIILDRQDLDSLQALPWMVAFEHSE